MCFHDGFLLAEGMIALWITILVSTLTLTLVTFCMQGRKQMEAEIEQIHDKYEACLQVEPCLTQCYEETAVDPY